MSSILRTGWTLEELCDLPSGEHDYFDRKSGALLQNSDFRADFAKALSAFANSGGGHILLGVADDGSIDGVPRTRGRTCMREWIEQVIPNLVEPAPVAFRVHLLDSTNNIAIPDDRVVIVVDIDDSHLAPFQSRSTKLYYHRVGGHSVPASHFYLETLRNRKRTPSFSIALSETRIMRVLELKKVFFVQVLLTLDVTNDGNVTPTYWHIDLRNNGESTGADGPIRRFGFPVPTFTIKGRHRIQKTPVLPGQTRQIVDILGICIDRTAHEGDLRKRVVEILAESRMTAAVAYESHVGDCQALDMSTLLDAVDESSLRLHTPSFDWERGEGSLGAGIQLEQFQLEDYATPEDHAHFGGVIENTSDYQFKDFRLVLSFFNEDENVTGHCVTELGRLPPKSSRHWKNWILAAHVWDTVRVDAFYYDQAWFEP